MRHLALLLMPPVQEAPPPPPPPPPQPMVQSLLHMSKELGLSDEQRTRLNAIHEAHGDRPRKLHEAFREAQKALMDVVQGDRAGDLKALNAAFAERHLAMMSEMATLHAESFAVLTPAQREKAKELLAHHPGGGPHDHAGVGPHGRPPQGQGQRGRPPRDDEDHSGPPERDN